MTRSKPNAFNHLHQLQRKLALGESLDKMISQWQNPKVARAVYGMGATEATAVINLMKFIPVSCVERLRLMATKYGMVKGPITHQALASKAICVGYTPDVSSNIWKTMVNTENIVDMLVRRLVQGWVDLPAGLRKSVGPDQVQAMQKIVGAFNVAVTVFSGLVPSEVLDSEFPSLRHAFDSGCMDIHLAAAAENNPWPWDLSDIPEFRSVLVRLQSDVESKQLKRNKELREQVQLATFTQLNEELSEDTQKLPQYYDRLGHVRLHWADQVTAYKRNRYNRGLEQVRQILDRRLPMMVTDPTGMSMEYATFKKSILDWQPNRKETCPWRRVLSMCLS